MLFSDIDSKPYRNGHRYLVSLNDYRQRDREAITFLVFKYMAYSGGARRRRRRRPPTASRLKGPRKQKSFAYKLLKRGLAKSFAYKLLKRGLANLMSPTSTSGVAPPLMA
ncbi:hypothetical protein EVAR_30491_1 [Eumeta japonica]|uniref:Uncharacterized protein n=1 Tax=Eumeta variegata TaxID=151549 RepID=A0A4C1W0P0_EUMVA|nr:hypothetical protein EVAR_30491_1 [Eumeta japonica]